MSTSTVPLKALSAARMVVGASCLLIPRQAGLMWGVPLAAGGESLLFTRMAGVRDFVIGAYLWRRVGEVDKARKLVADGSTRESLLNKSGSAENGRLAGIPSFAGTTEIAGVQDDAAIANVRSALWLGLVVDLVDIASVGACWVEGVPISGMGEIFIGGGALLFSAVAGQWLWAGRRI